MDVQQSRGYYWTQGDFCRAIFLALFTGVFSYLVHLEEWGDETSERAVHKWLKWKISTYVAEKKEASKEINQSKKLKPSVWGTDWLLKNTWVIFSRALRCRSNIVSCGLVFLKGLYAWQKIALCWNCCSLGVISTPRLDPNWIRNCLTALFLYKTVVNNQLNAITLILWFKFLFVAGISNSEKVFSSNRSPSPVVKT